MSEYLGWTVAQWRAAAAELGEPVTMRDLLNACFHDDFEGLDRLIEMQARWDERHRYAPLQSPIVIADTYRVRATC